MAAAAAKRAYGQGAVYGSLAYDFNNPELYQDEYTTAEPTVRPKAQPRQRTQTQTQTQTRVRTRARTAVHTRQSIAPLSIVGVLAAAFLVVIAILAQAQIVGISSKSVELQQQLDELEEQQSKLRIAYESAFNMAELEDYAIHTLGMQRPHADQIYYIDTSSPDKAVVVAAGNNDGFVDRVSDYLSGVASYFR
jgi:cell division protein FtsL